MDIRKPNRTNRFKKDGTLRKKTKVRPVIGVFKERNNPTGDKRKITKGY